MSIVTEFTTVLEREPLDLARASLVAARVEYPDLDPDRPMATLEELGREARERVSALAPDDGRGRIAALNALVFEDHGFAGNRGHYDDYRNSLLNVVIDRRLGIPITLALVYMEVARRAGFAVEGVAFPGHFLMRAPIHPDGNRVAFLDPFNGGRMLDSDGFRHLFARHLGSDDAERDPAWFEPCSSRLMMTRLLNNLKRTYLDARSFDRARTVTDMLLAVDPTRHVERRDRGLLASHFDDYPAALRDLEQYLALNPWTEATRAERNQIWENVKTLRRRVASLN